MSPARVPNDEAEVAYLAARCRLILAALRRAEPNATTLQEIERILDETVKKRNYRGLRMMRSDLLEMSQVLIPEDRAKLRALLDAQEADDPASRAR